MIIYGEVGPWTAFGRAQERIGSQHSATPIFCISSKGCTRIRSDESYETRKRQRAGPLESHFANERGSELRSDDIAALAPPLHALVELLAEAWHSAIEVIANSNWSSSDDVLVGLIARPAPRS